MSIKPGNIIEITFDRSSSGEGSFKSLVYDVTGKRLIISQTSPPLPSSYTNKTAHISYIFKKGSDARRFGFSAVISDFTRDYVLSSGARVPTFVLDMKDEPKEINLRKSFRVQTSRDSGLSLAIKGKNYSIIDVSLMGINFIQPLTQAAFSPADILEVMLTIDGRSYHLNANVVRVSETVRTRLIGAVFINTGRDLENILGKKILMIEREQLSRRWDSL